MAPDEIFDAVRRIEEMYYQVILSSDTCKVIDRAVLTGNGGVIISTSESTMEKNADVGLTGLCDYLLEIHTKNGDIEQRKNLERARKEMGGTGLPGRVKRPGRPG